MKQATKSKRSLFRRITRAALFTMLFGLSSSILLVLPLRWFEPATTAFMLFDDSGREPLLHNWVNLEPGDNAFALAAVAAEDQRFADHWGIDFVELDNALADARRGEGLRGASTITQQLAKNLFLTSSRSFIRKGLEAYLALVIEACLPKKRILELYTNVVELGPGIYGVDAASRYYFGLPAVRISDWQAALLAAVLPSPVRLRVDAPSAYVNERQQWILMQTQRLRRQSWLQSLK